MEFFFLSTVGRVMSLELYFPLFFYFRGWAFGRKLSRRDKEEWILIRHVHFSQQWRIFGSWEEKEPETRGWNCSTWTSDHEIGRCRTPLLTTYGHFNYNEEQILDLSSFLFPIITLSLSSSQRPESGMSHWEGKIRWGEWIWIDCQESRWSCSFFFFFLPFIEPTGRVSRIRRQGTRGEDISSSSPGSGW